MWFNHTTLFPQNLTPHHGTLLFKRSAPWCRELGKEVWCGTPHFFPSNSKEVWCRH